MKAALVLVLTAFTLLVTSMPLLGHHSTAAYDSAKVVTIKGVVTTVDWRNPHVHIHLNVSDAGSKVVNWDAETWGTGQMSLRGLTNGFLKPGDRVRIDVFVARDGTPRAFVRNLTLPDGHVVDGPPEDLKE